MNIIRVFNINWNQFISDLQPYIKDNINNIAVVEVYSTQYNHQKELEATVSIRINEVIYTGRGYTPVEVINDIINNIRRGRR